ncbi:MAG: Fe-S cluster assembly protein SufD [Phenylobacterium sp.]
MNLDQAIRLRDPALLPSRRDEDWRWTDLRSLLRTVPEPSQALAPSTAGPGPFDGLEGETVVIANGSGPAEITVAARQVRTVILRHVSGGDGAHAARLRISAGAEARLTLLESHEGGGGSLSLLSVVLELEAGASCERLVLSDMSAEAVAVVELDVHLSSAARFAQTLLTTGARRQRLETRLQHPGQGAECRLDGAYLLGGRRHADLTSSVRHGGPDGRTDQLARGLVDDQARAVFQGRITVQEGADGTDARMAHNALILSHQAEVDARPELEIYADDVACAHGATVGALDDDVLFYMRQRGLPEAAARTLLAASFLGEVIDRAESPEAASRMRSWLATRLGAGG